MKIECVKNKISELVSKAERVVGKNQNLPILGCFLLNAKDSALSVSATNLDMGFIGSIPVRVLSAGKAAVPAQVLSSFLSQLPNEGSISFEVSDGRLFISSKHSKTTIKLLNTDDFPTVPEVRDGVRSKIQTQDLLKGFQSVWYSAATSSMKPELSSVYVYHNQKQLIFTATDSFRLAEKKIQTKKQADFQPILVPFKNVSDIVRIFENNKEEIEIVAGKNQSSFTISDVKVVSRLIEGTFPDYQQILPKNFKTEVVLLKQDLISALKISTLFSGSFCKTDFKVSPQKKVFEVSSENDHVGKNLTQLESVVKGEELSISFNHKYIMDCFQSIQQDSVSLGFNGAHKPMVISGVGDTSFLYLVMPMNK